MTRFALIGAAGYIAPRHMKAISETGGDLVAAVDPNDSVGVIDSYFPDARFFTEFERFEVHLEELRHDGAGVDHVAIASPNYLHGPHMRAAMRAGADAICEKPLVLEPAEIDRLAEVEAETGRRVSTILQLRLHPAIIALRERIAAEPPDRVHDVELTYITSRGNWYLQSWKGEERKSGGIATNIGVHFFDMLHFLFGAVRETVVHHAGPTRAAGALAFDRARVRWFLSLEVGDVPAASRAAGQRTYRSITIDGEEVEFSGGFTDLHTRSYEEILAGRGFGLAANRTAIETVAAIRRATPRGRTGAHHPFLDGLAA